ncbi:MAG: serine hydrolase, partial [Bacteroidales bacterium]|nr:serine hydrolase [Bacteroidales bacterium]
MKNFVKTLLVCAAVFAVSCGSSEQETPEIPLQPEPDVAQELDAIMKRYSAVGLAVAVVDEGKIVYENTLGFKDLEAKTPWEKTDVLRIASISKSFVATSI